MRGLVLLCSALLLSGCLSTNDSFFDDGTSTSGTTSSQPTSVADDNRPGPRRNVDKRSW